MRVCVCMPMHKSKPFLFCFFNPQRRGGNKKRIFVVSYLQKQNKKRVSAFLVRIEKVG